MKNAKKIIALLLCAVLLVAGSVAGTLAYLTSTSDTVKNTFTVGNVNIKLEEYDVDPQTGVKDTSKVVTGLTDLELAPGRKIAKNPFITVDSKSEECWLFVKIENGLEGAGQIIYAEGWTQITGTNYYQYANKVAAGTKVDVFTQFNCDTTLDNTALAEFNGKEIKITAYAIQTEGFATVGAAWTAIKGQLGLN